MSFRVILGTLLQWRSLSSICSIHADERGTSHCFTTSPPPSTQKTSSMCFRMWRTPSCMIIFVPWCCSSAIAVRTSFIASNLLSSYPLLQTVNKSVNTSLEQGLSLMQTSLIGMILMRQVSRMCLELKQVRKTWKQTALRRSTQKTFKGFFKVDWIILPVAVAETSCIVSLDWAEVVLEMDSPQWFLFYYFKYSLNVKGSLQAPCQVWTTICSCEF